MDFEAGAGVRDITFMSGPDIVANLDLADPQDAANFAHIEALLEATGTPLEQLTMLNAVSADGKAFVGAVRLQGADTETVKTAYVESSLDDLVEPNVEEAEIAGKAVIKVADDAAPDQSPLIVYASGDTVWLISGSEVSAAQVLENLP